MSPEGYPLGECPDLGSDVSELLWLRAEHTRMQDRIAFLEHALCECVADRDYARSERDTSKLTGGVL